MIQLPIILDENGDVQVFETKEQAEMYIEAIDVRNDEYVAYDSEGRLLNITASKRNQDVRIQEFDEEKINPDALRRTLIGFLVKVGQSGDLESLGVRELVEKFVAVHGYAR